MGIRMRISRCARSGAMLTALQLTVVLLASSAHAETKLIAIGTISGAYEDLATETAAPLENGIPGNRLGGMGSGITHAGGNLFLALPDRGPNAKPYNSAVDDTARTSHGSTR